MNERIVERVMRMGIEHRALGCDFDKLFSLAKNQLLKEDADNDTRNNDSPFIDYKSWRDSVTSYPVYVMKETTMNGRISLEVVAFLNQQSLDQSESISDQRMSNGFPRHSIEISDII